MKILFLDVDGPLIPARLLTEQSGINQYQLHPTGTKVMDAEFIARLNELCEKHQFKIVFNTAHNDFGHNYIYWHASDNKINMDHLHEDFMTGYPTMYYKRIEAITAWLRRHPEVKYWIAVDDADIADGINHVQPTFRDGMTKEKINELEFLMLIEGI